VRDLWTMFVGGLRRVYNPSATLTVDEQLVGYRGRIPGRTYMPCKPRKYGVKTFWICESNTGFALNGLIYTGRDAGGGTHHNLAGDVVLQLAEPFFGTGRDIVTDRYFTSHALATALLQKNLTLLGTIQSNKREVPAIMKTTRGIEVNTTRFLFDHENKIILLSYSPKRNKNVLMLTSSHSQALLSTDDDRKPLIIKDYNATKGGVDTLDGNVEEFSCLRKTVRWPMIINYNIMNVAVCNAFIIFNHRNSITKASFLHQLTHSLCRKHVWNRSRKMAGDTFRYARGLHFDLQENLLVHFPRPTGAVRTTLFIKN
jgi:hypothetical protein